MKRLDRKYLIPALAAFLIAACALIAAGQWRDRTPLKIPVDLNATLTQLTDSTYQLHQDDGSTLRIVVNSKWQKLPKSLVFKRKK